jgi:hypothetical protein
MAFHEKAGRSQVGSFFFSLDKVRFSVASPMSPPFHPHSSLSDFVSLGASWVFSFQSVLPPDGQPFVAFLRTCNKTLTFKNYFGSCDAQFRMISTG